MSARPAAIRTELLALSLASSRERMVRYSGWKWKSQHTTPNIAVFIMYSQSFARRPVKAAARQRSESAHLLTRQRRVPPSLLAFTVTASRTWRKRALEDLVDIHAGPNMGVSSSGVRQRKVREAPAHAVRTSSGEIRGGVVRSRRRVRGGGGSRSLLGGVAETGGC